jgi:hypothetical protein
LPNNSSTEASLAEFIANLYINGSGAGIEYGTGIADNLIK